MINKVEMEFLLKNYSLLKTVLVNLQQELRQFVLSEDEVLDSLVLGNRLLYSNEPIVQVTPKPGERMTSIMQNHKEIADARNNEAIREIAGEIISISEIIEKLDNSINGLTENQRFIIQAIFFEGKSIKVIAHKLGITSEAARKERDRALKMLATICRIRSSAFKVAENLLERGA